MMKNHGDRSIGHYEVVVAIHRSRREIITYDPAHGFRKNSFAGFDSEWQAAGNLLLVLLPPVRS